MNKNNRLSYGSITKSNSGYRVLFFNPNDKKYKHVGSRATLELAKELYNETNYNFFSENSWALPKGISFYNYMKEFRFVVVIGKKIITVFHSKSLDEVVNAKKEFLNDLIS